MKKILATLAAVMLLPLALTAQATYVSQAGVTFFSGQPATATQTATVNIPNKSSEGNLQIVTTSITGSPSGCQLAMYSVSNANTKAPSSAAQTPTFSVSTGTNAQLVAATSASAVSTDAIKAVYTCATYPTAGAIAISFAPITTMAGSAVTITTPAQVENYNSGSLTVTPSDGTNAIGALVNYGSTPTAVKALSTNTYITNTVATTQAVAGDPCLTPNVVKSTVAVNISGAAGTTQLVGVSGTTAVYACYFQANVVGTTPTVLFEYGTSTTCVGTHALTGTIPVATTTSLTLGWGGTVLAAPASNGLCLVAGGTTPSIQGTLTYVQQ